MIKANELRIGNWLDYHGIPVEIYRNIEIDSAGVAIDAKYNIDPERKTLLVNLGPIPLTPEILEKCGFDYVDRYTCTSGILNFTRTAGGTGLIFHYDQENTPRSRQATLESLHQLQNLYFSLTGEELKVNL